MRDAINDLIPGATISRPRLSKLTDGGENHDCRRVTISVLDAVMFTRKIRRQRGGSCVLGIVAAHAHAQAELYRQGCRIIWRPMPWHGA
jgi:hypothetical protein